MGVGEAVIVAGIGCRKGASAAQIDAAIEAALQRAGRPLARLILPRIVVGPVTCALASTEEGP
jgi:cobalamin biosynthesis protein CbiG